MTIRNGRMRNDWRTKSVNVTSGKLAVPCARVNSFVLAELGRGNSSVSSKIIVRSLSLNSFKHAPSTVVLPQPVGPIKRIFFLEEFY